MKTFKLKTALLFTTLLLSFSNLSQNPYFYISFYSDCCPESPGMAYFYQALYTSGNVNNVVHITNRLGDTIPVNDYYLDGSCRLLISFLSDNSMAPHMITLDSAYLQSKGTFLIGGYHYDLENYQSYMYTTCVDNHERDIQMRAVFSISNQCQNAIPTCSQEFSNVLNHTGAVIIKNKNGQETPLESIDIVGPSGFGCQAKLRFSGKMSESPYTVMLDPAILNDYGIYLPSGNNYTFNYNQYLGIDYPHEDERQICAVSNNQLYNFSFANNCCDSAVNWVTPLLEYGHPIIKNSNGQIMTFYTSIQDCQINWTIYGDESEAPYTFFLNEDSLSNQGISLSDGYSYEITDNSQQLSSCVSGITAPNQCDLTSFVSVATGYFQNWENKINFQCFNTNNTTTNNVNIEIEMPEGVTFSNSFNEYNYTITGNTLHLNTNIISLGYYLDNITFNVPANIPDGTLHEYKIRASINDDTACVDSFTVNLVVGTSYDPNAKTVNQPLIIHPDTQEEFKYTIFFQNTGTAPAQDIYIIDTLSADLDWNSFQIINASHSMNVIDLGNGIKKFMFNQIWLPDSTSNEPESHGYVSYYIKEKEDNIEGSEIKNTAYIYFDQNDAIITNTIYNINSYDNLSTGNLSKSEMEVTIFPNPTKNKLMINSNDSIEKIAVLSTDGRILLEKNDVGQKQYELNINNFSTGMYIIQLSNKNQANSYYIIKE
jgi:uncharacterized repeat protein (TIGR01451 family)